MELANSYRERQKRNGPEFGYMSLSGQFIPRDQAGPIAEHWDQQLSQFDVNEAGQKIPHSDEVSAEPGGTTPMASAPTKLSDYANKLLARHKANNPQLQFTFETIPADPVAARNSPGVRFAGRKVAIARHATGEIVIDPEMMDAGLRMLAHEGPAAQEAWFNSIMEHERMHLATPKKAAEDYAGTLSIPERAVEARIYTGRWGVKLTEAELGWEALRRRMTRLERMTTDEVLGAVGREKWTLQGLEVINDTIRSIREGWGTTASQQGLAILGRIQRNLDLAIGAAGGATAGREEPAAQLPRERETETKPEIASLGTGELKNLLGDPLGTFYYGTPDDLAKWEAGKKRFAQTIASGDADAMATVWKENEAIKNKYGGNPPQPRPETEPAARLPRRENIERSEEARQKALELKISPAEIDWAQPGRKGSYRPISDAETANPDTLAEILTADARLDVPNTVTVSSSRRLGVWVERNAQDPRVFLLSAYKEGRSGARVVDPDKAGRERPTIPLKEMLKRYRPLYSILRDSPVRFFHQEFANLDDYQARFGEEASRNAQESIGSLSGTAAYGTVRQKLHHSSEGEFQGGQRQALAEVPTQTEEGAPSVEDLRAFHDFFEGEVPPTKHDFDVALNQAPAKGTRQMAAAVLQAAIAEERLNPNASPQENLKSALSKLYEDLKQADTRSEFIQNARRRLGEGVAEAVQAGGLGVPHEAPGSETALPPEAPASETARELTTPGRGPIPTGRPLLSYPQKFPPTGGPAMLSPEASAFVARNAGQQFPEPEARPAGPAEAAPAQAEAQGSPAGAVAEPQNVPSEEPGAFLPRLRQETQDILDRTGDTWRLRISRHQMVNNVGVILDTADNHAGIEAHAIDDRIRLFSTARPEGVMRRFLTPWMRGNPEVLAAANPVVESGFNLDAMPHFLKQIAAARVRAETMQRTGDGRQRMIARAYLRDIDASEAEVKYAQAHWNDADLQSTARAARAALNNIIRLERTAGINVRAQPGYLGHRYVQIWESLSTLFDPKVLGTRYREPRTFQTHYDALEAGPFMRVTHDIASLASHRYLQGMRGIMRESWRDGFLGMQVQDGLPLAVRANQPEGGGGLISPDPRYKVLGNTGLAVLNDYHSGLHQYFAENPFENWAPLRTALHFEQAVKHSLLLGDFFHLGRMFNYGVSMMTQHFGFRSGLSVLDYAERDMPEAVRRGVIRQKDVDWAHEPVPYKDGTITRRELIEKFYRESGANLGKIQDALYKDIVTTLTPMSGPVRRLFHAAVDPTAGRYNRFLFDKLTRGLMTESVVREYERQHAVLTKRGTPFSEDRLMRDIASDINEFYGNLGRQGLLKARWQQDMARLFFLAPNWVEGLIRKELTFGARITGLSKLTGARTGLTGLGATGMAIARGQLFMVLLTQAVNLITRRQFTWQNQEEGHKFDAWIPSFGADGNGFWFSPLAMFMELSHDIFRLSETKPTVMDALTQIAGNKQSPLTRAAIILRTGQTPGGQQTTTSGGRLMSAAGALLPTPITFGRYGQMLGHAIIPRIPAVPKGAIERQLFGTFSVKVEPAYSAAGNMARLADEFMDRQGLKKVTGWKLVQTDEPSYSKLDTALRDGDESAAARILQGIRKTHPDDRQIIHAMRLRAERPFTGNKLAERHFIGSLTDEQREMYSRAIDEKLTALQRFIQFYIKQP